MIEGVLLPQADDDSAPFWDGCLAGELRVQRCADCGRFRMPPRPMCPHCRSFGHEWSAVSGRGRIWSYVVPHPPLLPAFNALAPYNVVIVELDEDPALRLVGNLVSGPDAPINSIDPSTIAIGEEVEVCFGDEVDDESERPVRMPRWRRVHS